MGQALSLAAAIGPLVAASGACAQQLNVDPAGSGPIVAALHWLQGTLLGTVATAVAVIAVATVGFLMLTEYARNTVTGIRNTEHGIPTEYGDGGIR